jgi:hypothetical protein
VHGADVHLARTHAVAAQLPLRQVRPGFFRKPFKSPACGAFLFPLKANDFTDSERKYYEQIDIGNFLLNANVII